MKITSGAICALAILSSSASSIAGSIFIDFQQTGNPTAAGALAFDAANQVLPGAGTVYSTAAQQTAGGSDVGSAITVTLAGLNLPNGNLDFRSVQRGGATGESVNDWIGVDSRNGGTNVTLQVTVSGLLAGEYSWLSTHHDGGTGVTNGNQAAPGTFTLAAVGAPDVQNFAHSAGNGGNTTYAQFASNFTSNGSDVTFSIAVNDTGIADFGFINDLTITQVPEPSAALLGLAALGGLAVRRRR